MTDEYEFSEVEVPDTRVADERAARRRASKEAREAWQAKQPPLTAEETAPSKELRWRVGNHYFIHIYEGDRPVATFLRPEDAKAAVEAHNAQLHKELMDG